MPDTGGKVMSRASVENGSNRNGARKKIDGLDEIERLVFRNAISCK